MEILKDRTMEQLFDLWDMTEVVKDKDIPTVRGWIMDEFERRCPEGFDAWMDSDDYDAHPKQFIH